MKWYKHYTDSLDDPFIVELMDEFKHKGYTFWFGLVGIICQQIGNDLDKDFECSDIYLKRKLRISTTNIALMLHFCATKGKLIYRFENKKYYINIPNIARIKDNYTKDLQVPCKKLSLDKNKIKSKSKIKSVEPVKHIYGEYKKVRLTDKELDKLKEKFPDYLNRIKEMDEGEEMKKYGYKSHYLAILKWARNEEDRKNERDGTDKYEGLIKG